MSPLRDDEVFGGPDKARIKAERAEARRLRATAWWQRRIGQGICHYCGHKVGREAGSRTRSETVTVQQHHIFGRSARRT